MPARSASAVPAVFILFGRKAAREDLFDDFLAREHIRRIRARLGGEEELAVSEYEAASADPADILDEISTPAMWGDKRLVILRGAEAMLAPPAANRERLVPIIERLTAFAGAEDPPGHLALVATALEVRSGVPRTAFNAAQALLDAVDGRNGLLSCVPPYENALRRTLSQIAAQAGRRLAPGAAETLVQLVGSDQMTLAEEMEKLIAATTGADVITSADVETYASQHPQASVFDLADAVIDGDAASALAALDGLFQSAATRSTGFLLATLRSSFQRYHAAARAVEEGQTPRAAAEEAGVHRYFRDAFVERLRKWDARSVEMLEERLGNCDIEIKTGTVQDRIALERFICDACARRWSHESPVGRWIYEV